MKILLRKGWVSASVTAYKKVYPLVRDAIESGQNVTVNYIDYDYVEGKPVKTPNLIYVLNIPQQEYIEIQEKI